MQQVRALVPFRLREELVGDDRRPPQRHGRILHNVSWLQNDAVAVAPPGTQTTADSYDPAGFGVAHSLFHQVIAMSTCTFFGGVPGLPSPFHLCELQLLNRSGVARTAGSQSGCHKGSTFDRHRHSGGIMAGKLKTIGHATIQPGRNHRGSR